MTELSLWQMEIPQTQPLAPYQSHLRASSTTRSVIVRVTTDEGIVGWGEYNTNFIETGDLSAIRHRAQVWLAGRDPRQIASYHLEAPFESRLKAGIELALWDIAGKAVGLPVYMLLGGAVRKSIELAACMGITTGKRAGELAEWYVSQGFGTLKTKAGRSISEDVEMIRGIREAVGDRLQVRVDPNCAYSLTESLDLARQLVDCDLQYLEQPLPVEPLTGAHQFRQQSSVPLALNESVVEPVSVMRILNADAADVVLPDTHIAGGILPCVKIGHLCEAAGIPCVMHCGHDLGPKTAAMLHVAASGPAYSLANDCTYYGLEDDILTERLPIDHGTMNVPEGPGLGIEIDLGKLKHYATEQ